MPTAPEGPASWSQTVPTPIEPCGRTPSAGRPQSPSDARPIPRIDDATSPSRSLARQGDRRDDPEKRYSLLRAPGATAETVAPWRQSKVRLGHPIKLTLGIQSPRVQRPPCRPQPRYPVSCIKVREADENSHVASNAANSAAALASYCLDLVIGLPVICDRTLYVIAPHELLGGPLR